MSAEDEAAPVWFVTTYPLRLEADVSRRTVLVSDCKNYCLETELNDPTVVYNLITTIILCLS